MRQRIEYRPAVLAAAALALSVSTAFADLFWVGGSGNWNDPANWSATEGGPGGAGTPNENEFVYVLPADAINRTILLTPSNDTFKAYRLQTGATGSGSLLFNLTQGTFTTEFNWQVWAGGGQTAVVQTGGLNLTTDVFLASDAGAVGTYDLHAGTLQGGPLGLAYFGGQGIFRQHGGHVDVNGLFVYSNSRYEMGSGSLNVTYNQTNSSALEVGPDALFIQNGGSIVTNQLAIYGHYQWNGGALQVQEVLKIAGKLDFPTIPATLQVNGLVDLTSPDMQLTNAQNVSLNLTDTSLLVRPASLDPQTIFGTFSNPGFTHIPGTPLTIPAGRTLNLLRDLEDRIDVYGTVDTTRSFHLTGGIIVGPNGILDAKSGSILLPSGLSEVQGGEVRARTLEVSGASTLSFPPVPATQFNQAGGEIAVYDLTVGRTGPALFVLSAGSLQSETTRIGRGSFVFVSGATGSMVQTGGTHSVLDALEIGFGNLIAGSYTIGGGQLIARSVRISGLYGFGPGAPTLGTGHLQVTDSSSEINIANELAFGPKSNYAAVPGTTIHMTGISSISNTNLDPATLSGLEHTTFIFEGGADVMARIEAAGEDLGLTPKGFVSNFMIGVLQIGGLNPSILELRDWHDNNPSESELPDALYVDHLILNPGSELYLHDTHLYAQQFTNNGGTLVLTGSGQLSVVPEPVSVLPWIGFAALVRRRRKSIAHA